MLNPNDITEFATHIGLHVLRDDVEMLDSPEQNRCSYTHAVVAVYLMFRPRLVMAFTTWVMSYEDVLEVIDAHMKAREITVDQWMHEQIMRREKPEWVN